MRFEEALAAMRIGKRVRRPGWSNRQHYIIALLPLLVCEDTDSGDTESFDMSSGDLLAVDWEIVT